MGYIFSHSSPLGLTPKVMNPMASPKTRSSAPVLPLSLHRSFSPTTHSFSTKLYNSSPLITFDLARSVSPKRNLQVRSPVPSAPPMAGQRAAVPSGSARKTCLCSPSTHPGAFRCKLHRIRPPSSSSSSASTNSQLHMRRSAMKNSLARIGSVEGGEWMKKALSALIRPSSHQVRRRTEFHPQPSRLRHMTAAAIS